MTINDDVNNPLMVTEIDEDKSLESTLQTCENHLYISCVSFFAAGLSTLLAGLSFEDNNVYLTLGWSIAAMVSYYGTGRNLGSAYRSYSSFVADKKKIIQILEQTSNEG